MREMLDRALEKISADLYSEDCHAVMELIQNAVDNQYLDGVEARRQFALNHEAVVAVNNEGMSTRQRQRQAEKSQEKRKNAFLV
jgi:hypothetical protein